jgi:DNA-binding response OmpR family regulator
MDPRPMILPDTTPPALPMAAARDSAHASRPRMVLAHADGAYAALVCRHFRRLGWEVHVVAGGDEARELAGTLAPAAVVLDTALPGESGWLTCKKLTGERPGLRVILVAPEADEQGRSFAAFVGAAALVAKSAEPLALVDQVYGTALAAAG